MINVVHKKKHKYIWTHNKAGQHHLKLKPWSQKSGNVANIRTSSQGAKNLTSLNQDMALKLFKKFINLEFLSKKLQIYKIFKPCLDLMMSFKNCIRIE